MKKICFVLGTRPEIIKMAPLLRRVVAKQIPFQLIHSNQHYDASMDQIFFQELHLPSPAYHLKSAAPSAVAFIANVMRGCEDIWQTDRPSVVVVQGDTNTTFAAAFVANKNGIPVAHVEAGLRSDDLSMPEEINRILTDCIAQRLYAPTHHQLKRLERQGLSADSILLTGNTIQDAVREHLSFAKAAALPEALRLPSPFAILTLHRPALVDNPDVLRDVLSAVDCALTALSMKALFLVHPRTRKTLSAINFSGENFLLHEPIGYLPMLHLLSSAACILTDSGGLQEEAAILRVPCVTLRSSTERPETLDAGGNVLLAPESASIGATIEQFVRSPKNWKDVYTVAHPSDTILADLTSRYV